MSRASLTKRTGLILACGGLLFAAGANLLVVQATLQVAEATPPHSPIRPIGLGLYSFLMSVGAFLTALPLSVSGALVCRRSEQWWGCLLGGIGTCLSLLPHFLFQHLFHHFVEVKGWELLQ